MTTRRRKVDCLAAAWLTLWITLSLVAWMGVPASFDLSRVLLGPSLLHPLGFDAFGRDLLFGLLRASAFSCAFALVATGVTCASGIVGGAGLALLPERIRFVSLRGLDTLLAFPSLLISLGWAAIRGPGWDTLFVSLLVGLLPGFVRFIYSRARELLAEEYVLAAHSLGATPVRIVHHHLSPALIAMASIKAPALFSHALLAEATLSFLGVGAPIGAESWGSLLAQGQDYLLEAPHLAIGTGVPLILTVLALQHLSERLTRQHLRSG
jgi:peptide/nickel transport system permease protein